jgi:hypothetical protein
MLELYAALVMIAHVYTSLHQMHVIPILQQIDRGMRLTGRYKLAEKGHNKLEMYTQPLQVLYFRLNTFATCLVQT